MDSLYTEWNGLSRANRKKSDGTYEKPQRKHKNTLHIRKRPLSERPFVGLVERAVAARVVDVGDGGRTGHLLRQAARLVVGVGDGRAVLRHRGERAI